MYMNKIKGERKKSWKKLSTFLGKREFYLFYYDAIFKVRVLSKVDLAEHWNWRHCSQKTYVFLKFVEKYVRLKWKNES